MKVFTGALRVVSCSILPLFCPTFHQEAFGQSSGCSDVILEVAEAGIAADSAGAPFGQIMLERSRLALPDSGTTREELCTFVLLATLQNHSSGHGLIREALERVVAFGGGTPDVRYGLVAIRNQRGGHEAALLDTSVTKSMDPLVRFEVARALFLAGHADVAHNIMRTVVTADPGAAALLYHFTYPVLSAESRIAIARTPSHNRGQRLLDEWEDMAWSSGLATWERLAVHFRRIVHAHSSFFGLARPLSDSTEVGTSGQAQPDPRWEIYIRFGEPARVVRTMYASRGGGPSSEHVTWVYADPTERHPMLFHFSGANGRYSLITNAGCILEWLSDRASLSPRIGQVYQACTEKSDFRRALDQLRRETLAKYQENRHREFVVPATLSARFAYRLYTFSDPATMAHEVVAVAHVPAREIPSSGMLRAGAFLRSEWGESHSQMVDYRATRTGDAMIAVTIPHVSAGDYSYRVRTSDIEFKEGFVYGGEYTVELNGTGQLKMSSLVVAKAETIGPLRRSTEKLHPILGTISDDSFDLYGEAYGIPAGEIVHVELTIARKRFLRRTTEVAMKFTDTTNDEGLFAFRRLIQHDLDPGEYEITVRLHTETIGRAEQATTVEIR